MAYEFIRHYKNNEGVIDSFGINVAFGDAPPTETNKLWVKTSTPNDISIKLVSEEYIEIPTSMPANTPKCETVIGVGNKVFMFGPYGYGQSSGTINIRYYNIETGTVSTLGARLPNKIKAGNRASVGVYNNKIYIIGGTEKIDTDNVLSWMDLGSYQIESTTIPLTGYSHSACAVIGGRLYMLGGQGSNTNTTYDRICYVDLETLECVKSEVKLEYATTQMGCTVYDGKIYVFGGCWSNGSTNNVMIYDPELDTIATVGSIPYNLYGAISGRIGDKMYFLWGKKRTNSGDTSVYNMFYYDLTTNKYTIVTSKMPYPSGESNSGFTDMNDVIYVVAHKLLTGTTFEAKQYKFMAKPEVNEGSMVIETTEKSNFVKLIDDGVVKATINAYRTFVGNSQGIGELVEAAVNKDGEWVNI